MTRKKKTTAPLFAFWRSALLNCAAAVFLMFPQAARSDSITAAAAGPMITFTAGGTNPMGIDREGSLPDVQITNNDPVSVVYKNNLIQKIAIFRFDVFPAQSQNLSGDGDGYLDPCTESTPCPNGDYTATKTSIFFWTNGNGNNGKNGITSGTVFTVTFTGFQPLARISPYVITPEPRTLTLMFFGSACILLFLRLSRQNRSQ